MPAYFHIIDPNGHIVRIDASTHAQTTIEYEHHEIHGSSSFTCWYEQEVSDDGDQSIIAFKTPAGAKWGHLTFAASASQPAEAWILEAPDVVDNTGAPLAIWNRNRAIILPSIMIDTSQNPDVVDQATFFTEVTMGNVTAGDEIDHQHLEAGRGPRAIGGVSRGSQEWILKPEVHYAFIVESLNDDTNVHNLQVNWYEHTDRN